MSTERVIVELNQHAACTDTSGIQVIYSLTSNQNTCHQVYKIMGNNMVYNKTLQIKPIAGYYSLSTKQPLNCILSTGQMEQLYINI